MLKKSRIFLVCVCLMILSCAGMTPKQQYLSQRMAFNEFLLQFNTWAVVQSEDVKAKLRSEIIPIIDEASTALNAYESALYLNTGDPMAKLQFYLDLKTKLLNAVLVHGFHYEEGVIR